MNRLKLALMILSGVACNSATSAPAHAHGPHHRHGCLTSHLHGGWGHHSHLHRTSFYGPRYYATSYYRTPIQISFYRTSLYPTYYWGSGPAYYPSYLTWPAAFPYGYGMPGYGHYYQFHSGPAIVSPYFLGSQGADARPSSDLSRDYLERYEELAQTYKRDSTAPEAELLTAIPSTASKATVGRESSESIRLASWEQAKASEITSSTRPRAYRVERAKVAIPDLTPTSFAWAQSAIGTVDDLIAKGEIEAAIDACQAMQKNPQLPAEIYLRHAVLKLFGSKHEVDLGDVLELLNAACAAGCELTPAELNSDSIRSYIAPTNVSLDEALNQFSKFAIAESKSNTGNLLLIAALLRLDGQDDRSKTFANEAFSKAAESGVIEWSSLLQCLTR